MNCGLTAFISNYLYISFYSKNELIYIHENYILWDENVCSTLLQKLSVSIYLYLTKHSTVLKPKTQPVLIYSEYSTFESIFPNHDRTVNPPSSAQR